MTDYRCDHGYYAMGRDCPACQKERENARNECDLGQLLLRLQQAERDRDEANEACREKQAIIERMLESERQAVALLQKARRCIFDDDAPRTVSEIDAFLVGQPAPANTKHTEE